MASNFSRHPSVLRQDQDERAGIRRLCPSSSIVISTLQGGDRTLKAKHISLFSFPAMKQAQDQNG